MSQQNFLQGLGAAERKEFLQSNAAGIYEGKYSRPLTDEEITKAKDELSQEVLTLMDLEADFKELKDAHKAKVKPHEETKKLLATQVRTKQITANGIVYDLPNYETGFMEIYNQDGELLSTRKLRPEEKQGNVFQLPKTAN